MRTIHMPHHTALVHGSYRLSAGALAEAGVYGRVGHVDADVAHDLPQRLDQVSPAVVLLHDQCAVPFRRREDGLLQERHRTYAPAPAFGHVQFVILALPGDRVSALVALLAAVRGVNRKRVRRLMRVMGIEAL